MGQRKVTFTHSIDIDVTAIIEWCDPPAGGWIRYSEDHDDPREVSELRGDTPLDQAVIDAVLETESGYDHETALHQAAIEAHDNCFQYTALGEALKGRIYREFFGGGPNTWGLVGGRRAKTETEAQKATRLEREKLGQMLLDQLKWLLDEIRREAIGTVKDDVAPTGSEPVTEGELEMVAVYHLTKRAQAAMRHLTERAQRVALQAEQQPNNENPPGELSPRVQDS